MKDEFQDALEIQRRHFESHFGSLASLGFEDKTQVSEESDDFCGFSESDDDSHSDRSDEFNSDLLTSLDDGHEMMRRKSTPKVVRLYGGDEQFPVAANNKRLARSGRVPTLQELEAKQDRLNKISKKQKKQAAEEDAENLDNDLKLQRLLSESHILAQHMESSGVDLTIQTLDYEAPIGNARRRILDHRIRTVLALNSSTGGKPKKLEKMPMNMRKGMIKARERRAAEYECEAREAGIVLAKVKKGETRVLDLGRGVTLASDRLGLGKKQAKKMRDRGLRINTIGKSTRNGLRISQEEIDRISNQGKKRRRK